MRTLFALALLANACCGNPKPAVDASDSAQPPDPVDVNVPGDEGEPADPDATLGAPGASGSAPDNLDPPPPHIKLPSGISCKLPAPKLSEDSCQVDADCGVSAPCHAEACVAKSKSNPATPDTMCTMSLVCHSADANRCGCHEGRCALIPPPDKTQ